MTRCAIASSLTRSQQSTVSSDRHPHSIPHRLTLDDIHTLQTISNTQLILHIPFTSSLRLRTLLLFPPAPSHPHRPGRVRIFANINDCPSFSDLEDGVPIMDLDITNPPPGYRRGVNGEREVEEWGLKVQKLANVHSVTLLFVSVLEA
jgi:hypothetical protein